MAFPRALPALVTVLGLSIACLPFLELHRLHRRGNLRDRLEALREDANHAPPPLPAHRRRNNATFRDGGGDGATLDGARRRPFRRARPPIAPRTNAKNEPQPPPPSSPPSSTSWKDDLASPLTPLSERGTVYVSLGTCCSRDAQRNTVRETSRHDHSSKPYDVAAALASSLWQLQLEDWLEGQEGLGSDGGEGDGEERGGRGPIPKVAIVATLGYLRGNAESERNLANLRAWLDGLNDRHRSRSDNNATNAANAVVVRSWSYDVSGFDDPHYACVRVGQMGRYYVRESGFVTEDDFVMTTDGDVFAADAPALLPFLRPTRGGGGSEPYYHRVFVRDWAFTRNGTRTIQLFGLGMTSYDWHRSLTLAGAPTLRDAVTLAGRRTSNTWGFDQTLSTAAVRRGGLCRFPSNGGNPEEGPADDHRTCYKGDGTLRNECLDGYDPGRGCLYSHFTPKVDGGMLRRTYDAIVAEMASRRRDRDYPTAEMILGKEGEEEEGGAVAERRETPDPVRGRPEGGRTGPTDEDEDDDLASLRRSLRPNVDYSACRNAFRRRSCRGDRPPSLPFVSGDFFRCIADVAYDETNEYRPHGEDVQCLWSLKNQGGMEGHPFLVFVKTDLVHNSQDRLKEIDAAIPGPYLLITHNSDFGAEIDTEQLIEKYMPKLLHWYGQNMPTGSRTTTLPIGLENRKWGRILPEYYFGDYGTVTKTTKLAVASFRPRNAERRELVSSLQSPGYGDWVDVPKFGYHSEMLTHEAWLRKMAGYKFAISPVGNGLDCHRTWEMILIGVVPVMRSTIIDPVFASLRSEGAVLIVNDWKELNRTLLEDHWAKFGKGLVERMGGWLQRPDNVMLAKHWVVHRFTSHANDPRLKPTVLSVEEKRALAKQIHFVTYGNGLYSVAKTRITKEAQQTGWFASVQALGPDDLSAEFRAKYKEILEQPRGGGYWIWKFDVIEQMMSKIEEGQFLVYLDAGSSVNSGGETRFFEYIKMVNESQYDLIGFQLPFPEYKWTVRPMFEFYFHTSAVENTMKEDVITQTGQLEANTLVLQKGFHYRQWMERCKALLSKDPWVITDKYNEETRNLVPEFKENRHDQSIMSVVRKKLGFVRVDGMETKHAQQDKPFHLTRKRD